MPLTPLPLLALDNHALGAIAALLTAVCWTIGGMFFYAAGKRSSSWAVNRMRLVFASALLAAWCLMFIGDWSVPPAQLACLAISGLVGLALGDGAYFEALLVLGPRRAMLIQSSVPIWTVLLMIPLTGEELSIIGIVGMAVTIAGIAWVVSERPALTEVRGNWRRGVSLALIGAAGQAAGMIFAKAGLGSVSDDSLLAQFIDGPAHLLNGELVRGKVIDPVYGTLLRMLAATVVLIGFAFLQRRTAELGRIVKSPAILGLTLGGSIAGPAIGVALSLYAVAVTNTAVASTLMATFPIMVIPVVVVLYKEPVSVRAVAGAFVAVAGAAILIFRIPLREYLL